MMQNFMQDFVKNAEKFGRHALTGTALVGASYLSSCAPEEPDPGFGVEVMHGDAKKFSSSTRFGEPHSGGVFHNKGDTYSFEARRRNPGQENATIHFSDVDVVTDNSHVRLLWSRTVETTGNKPYTMTITFNDKATLEESKGVKRIVLQADENTRLLNEWGTEEETQERLKDTELLKRDMRKMMTDYNNLKDQGHLPVTVTLEKLDGPAL